ncbi:MAG: class I SAM-dependent methyltransferase [Elsteraceae bacterium]
MVRAPGLDPAARFGVTALAERLAARVRAEGPIPLADFMAAALADPEGGYYMTRDPFGAAGDFTTAPEITQAFGELLGLWCAEVWRGLGAPTPMMLVELGPGRGALMADALRAIGKMAPEFRAALTPHLIEISPVLRAAQASRLEGQGAVWLDDLAQLPPGPAIFLANEFFDALPIDQAIRRDAGWRNRRVGLDAKDRFVFVDAEVVMVDREAEPGAILERCLAGESIAASLGRRAAQGNSAALIIDYGEEGALGDSLQAVRGHRAQDALADPGSADLTAHVDFAALARVTRGVGAAVFGPIPQGALLRALGLVERTEQLMRNARPDVARSLRAGMIRLIDPAAMGTLFKALAILPPGHPPPPGFPA